MLAQVTTTALVDDDDDEDLPALFQDDPLPTTSNTIDDTTSSQKLVDELLQMVENGAVLSVNSTFLDGLFQQEESLARIVYDRLWARLSSCLASSNTRNSIVVKARLQAVSHLCTTSPRIRTLMGQDLLASSSSNTGREIQEQLPPASLWEAAAYCLPVLLDDSTRLHPSCELLVRQLEGAVLLTSSSNATEQEDLGMAVFRRQTSPQFRTLVQDDVRGLMQTARQVSQAVLTTIMKNNKKGKECVFQWLVLLARSK